jgi:hypothetical protein
MSSVDRWARQYNSNKGGGGGNWLRLENGETLIRIIPFVHKVTEGDLALGRYLPSEVKVGEAVEEFYLPYRSHFKPERGICGLIKRADKRLVGSCTYCQQASDIRKTDTKEDRQAARAWQARTQFNVQVVDLDNNPDTIQIWSAPQTFIDWVIKQMTGRAFANKVILGEGGLDILITLNKETKNPQEMYAFSFMPREDTTALKLSALKNTWKDLFQVQEFVPPEFQVYISNPVSLGNDGAETKEPAPPSRKRASQEPAPAPAQTQTAPAPTPTVRTQETTPAPAAEPPKRGRGRPKKEPEPEPAKDDSIQVGRTIRFKNGSEVAVGKIVSGPDNDGLFDVEVGPGDVYGVMPEEMILG